MVRFHFSSVDTTAHLHSLVYRVCTLERVNHQKMSSAKIYQMPTAVSPNAVAGVPASFQQMENANVGIIIKDVENLRPNGVSSNATERKPLPFFARMVIEFAAVFALMTITGAIVILNPQGAPGSSFNVGFVLFGLVFITVVLFDYATGVSMNVLTTLAVTLSGWVLRAIARSTSEKSKKPDDLEPEHYGFDLLTMLAMWFVQIAATFLGLLMATVPFLSGNTLKQDLTLLVPRYGIATWLPPVFQITSWQASVMNSFGSFIVVAAALYAFCIKDFNEENRIWAALLRGGAQLIATLLFFGPTGAAFDIFRWVASAGMVDMSLFVANGEAYAYVVGPLLGAFAAMLFLWFWFWFSKATHLEADYNKNHSGGYEALDQTGGTSKKSTVGLPYVLGAGTSTLTRRF